MLFRSLATSNKAKTPNDFFAKVAAEEAPAAKSKIAIDERKFVGRVETDALVKMSENSIGKTTVAQDDIQASVSKLAQLKGK